jgi:uroporphyrinogen-III synthase
MIELRPLAGTTIVVTRPARQAGPLCRLIEAQGGKAISFPSLEIECSTQPQPLLQQLEQFNIAIFISANAVECATHFMQKPLPQKTILAAVGKRTATLLQQHHHEHPILSPDNGADSEALLEMPELQQVQGKHILIVRGEGGRELLAETLIQRGAQVEYAEVYRRVRPRGDLAALQDQNKIDLMTATSNESLQNLYDMAIASQRDWLLALPLIVIGQRGAELAQRLGFQHPAIIATEASDAGLLQAMIKWRGQHRQSVK